MRIAITGALGHIGSQLLRTLPLRIPDAHFTLLDNLHTERYCSLFSLPSGGRFTFIEADIRTCEFDAALHHTDLMVHLAAITDAPGSFENSELAFSVNTYGTQRIAEWCAARGCTLIFLSTTSVYGARGHTVDEQLADDQLNPESPYAASKLAAERLIASLGLSHGLRYVILRLGTVCGPSPGMQFHTAVNKFCWQAATRQPLTVWRTALHQRRPYAALRDVAGLIAHIIGTGRYGNTFYNVVSENLTVSEVLDRIRRVVPVLEVISVDNCAMTAYSYSVASERLRAIGFSPQYSVADAITDTFGAFAALL